MKTTEIKKALKNASIKITLQESNYGIMSGHIWIKYGEYDDSLVHIKLQSNDILREDGYHHDVEPRNPLYYFPGYTGFYAPQISTVHKFDGDNTFNWDNPVRASNFIKLINKQISTKNYGYVHPKCSLSQIVAALTDLGAYVQIIKVNERLKKDWHRDRLDQIEGKLCSHRCNPKACEHCKSEEIVTNIEKRA